jgi:hypothetical protein
MVVAISRVAFSILERLKCCGGRADTDAEFLQAPQLSQLSRMGLVATEEHSAQLTPLGSVVANLGAEQRDRAIISVDLGCSRV